MRSYLKLIGIGICLAFVSATCGGVTLSEDPNAHDADKIIEAARRAGENARQLARHIAAGDQAGADKMIGMEINIGGYPTQRSKESWTMRSRDGLTVIATKIQEPNDPEVELEDSACSMYGKLSAVDVKTKTITLEDVELIYVEKMN